MTGVECSPVSTQAMSTSASVAVAAKLKALSDPLRLRMLSAISADARGEVCVCDLEQLADVSQPTISHHLKVMRDAGVLESERRGTWVYYRIAASMVSAVTALISGFALIALEDDGATATALTDVDEGLARIAADLHNVHPTLDEQLVLHVVRESYAALARRTTVSHQLLPITERFARQRLGDLSRDRTTGVKHVLFVCVANAGRSQLAAALLNERSGGSVVARSAGSAPASTINPHVRTLIEAIDVNEATSAYPKPLTDDAVRAADIVITMGCGDVCPIIPGIHYEDWAVGDPALASPEGIEAIRDAIAIRVDQLLDTLQKAAS